MNIKFIYLFLCFFLAVQNVASQEIEWWHDKIRKIHYIPEGESFVLKNGDRKFNRALYGTNTGFRVEAGDLPEFALYMPGMGGNFKLGIISENNSKWITEADHVSTTYTPGIMEYKIMDKLLDQGRISIQVLALADAEGLVLKMSAVDIPQDVSLIWAFGGASGEQFHRDGDIGADPESVFYLQPEYCLNNDYQLKEKSFYLKYGWDRKNKINTKEMLGFFPSSEVHLGSAKKLDTPLELWNSEVDSLPVVVGKIENVLGTHFWEIKKSDGTELGSHGVLSEDFARAVQQAKEISSRVEVNTPDPFINTLGGVLATAGDAIWESPAFVHGSVAWRMHLNGWRGAYVADPLGWHDRAREHFGSYGNSQVLKPATGPVVPDTTRNFARQKEEMGTAVFSRGYISRHPNNNTVAHHYDMNLVFIDQLLNHFQWMGNKEFIEQMWLVIKRHLTWEQRNFDSNNDGLYDAYAAIWASDALQYSGGGVTYTSSYNYRANKMAVQLAKIVGENPEPYQKEADQIYKSIQSELWLPEKGVYAEYKDLLGNKLLHKNPGIWTIYHAIDKGVPNPFQAYQMLNYVDTEIPHIPVHAKGLEKDDLYLLSTTNWQPYTWSVNNVALAENLNMALAYWQTGRSDEAHKLWESALIESMYLGASPGSIQQLSFYDAMRGELYRDFADPIGMAARTLVEGLFGIQPNALEDSLTIDTGFPKDWKYASLKTPDISLSYKKVEDVDVYEITPRFRENMHLRFIANAPKESIEMVEINGNKVNWHIDNNSVGKPKIIIESPYEASYTVRIKWKGDKLEKLRSKEIYYEGEKFRIRTSKAEIVGVKDPQKVLRKLDLSENNFEASIKSGLGGKTIFLKLQQGEMVWWQPISFEVKPKLKIISSIVRDENVLLQIQNLAEKNIKAELILNPNGKEIRQNIDVKSDAVTPIEISKENLVPGTNDIWLEMQLGKPIELILQNWDIKIHEPQRLETIDISSSFNSKVTDIFKNEYLSPRPDSPTLQLPTTGIGNWAYPNIMVEINDSGLREKARKNGEIITPQGIPFKTPSKKSAKNIAFVSQWDYYPDQIKIQLEGQASHAYVMMAGSTNPMQSRFVNGALSINYKDGSSETLKLKNPENWWPIEQDYYVDGYAFTTGAPKPPRVYFKTGTITRDFTNFKSIKGYSNFGIDGGAGTILDIPLDPSKELESLVLRSVANDVVIGLMSVTLQR